MDNFLSNVSPEIMLAFAVCFFFMFILFLATVSNSRKLKRLRTKYNNFMNGLGDKNIEQLLDTYLDKVNQMSVKNKEIENHILDIERNLVQCVQKVGIVRYNAFENVGSDLSFSIALLDNKDDGIVLSGIYSRDSSSTYAKPIISGKSRYTLSAEEMQALDFAKKSGREKIYTDK